MSQRKLIERKLFKALDAILRHIQTFQRNTREQDLRIFVQSSKLISESGVQTIVESQKTKSMRTGLEMYSDFQTLNQNI